MMWTGWFVFISGGTSCGDRVSQLSCEFTILSSQRLFSTWEKPHHVLLDEYLSFSKIFAAWSKNSRPFLSQHEKYRMFSCTNFLLRNSHTPMSQAKDLILRSLSIIAGTSITNLDLISNQNYQREASNLSYLSNQHWNHRPLFESSKMVSDWHSDAVKCSYWSFQFQCNNVEFAMLKFMK